MAYRCVITRLFDGFDQLFCTGSPGNVRFSDRHIRLLNIRALFKTFFHAFNAVTAGQAVQGQVDSL
ncbi:Uncharacterised protein [Shigella sonnei]|nr:Uncharacterised protein [Shigella sonnei]